MTHQVGNWIGLTLILAIPRAVCQILIGQMRVRQKGLRSWARSVDYINQIQHNPVTLMSHPVHSTNDYFQQSDMSLILFGPQFEAYQAFFNVAFWGYKL